MKTNFDKKCKKCSEIFVPYKTTDKFCYPCLKTEQALKNLKKIKTEKTRKQKEDLLSLSDYIKLAQQVFNKFIRLRDKEQKCISCSGKLGTKYDAGHYYSAGGHYSLRFNEDNVHAQCVACNQHKHGNIQKYRFGLIDRIGQKRLDKLDEISNETRKFTKDELKAIIQYYKIKVKELNC